MAPWSEVRHYPWKYTALPEHPELSIEIIADYKERVDMMDPLTVQHVEAYPSVEQLRSPASMVEAMVPASVLEETTVLIERGWSHVRR